MERIQGLARSSSEADTPQNSKTEIAGISLEIMCLCRRWGLPRQEADDLLQDVWVWLLRVGLPREAISPSWIGAVVRNFVLRYFRQSSRRRSLEGLRLDVTAEPAFMPDMSVFETNEMLDRVSEVLPKTERSLLALIRQGNSLAHAEVLLKIPKGSRSYRRKRLLTLAGLAFHPRRRRPAASRRTYTVICGRNCGHEGRA